MKGLRAAARGCRSSRARRRPPDCGLIGLNLSVEPRSGAARVGEDLITPGSAAHAVPGRFPGIFDRIRYILRPRVGTNPPTGKQVDWSADQ